MSDYSKELAVAKNLALRAGDIMRRYFEQGVAVTQKQDGSPVTQADIEINKLVIEEITKNFGDIVVGEEESTGNYGMGRRWICDPIDGTRAFTLGLPFAMFSLALVVDGAPAVAVAYDPFLNRLYEATQSGGSFCNEKPIHVSSQELSGGNIAVSSSPIKVWRDKTYATLLNNLSNAGVQFGSFHGSVYKGCLVARGNFVGYLERGIHAHDVAATDLIVREAGGMVTGFDGKRLDFSKPFRGAVMSNAVAHEKLLTCAQEK